MPATPSDDRFLLKPWHMAVGSGLILLHLAAVAVSGFMVSSGPWSSPMGPSMAEPPQFAKVATQITGPIYEQGLRIGVNSRYQTNRPDENHDIQFEYRLRNEQGEVVKILRFPDKDANPWVRHRQALLAQSLVPDRPMPPLEGETIAPQGQKEQRRAVWRDLNPMSIPDESEWFVRSSDKKLVSDKPMKLKDLREMWGRKQFGSTHEVSENQVDWEPGEMLVHLFTATPNTPKRWLVRRAVNTLPRQMTIAQPNGWTMLVARAYGSYLCRLHGAASADLIRFSQPGYPPVILFMPAGQQEPPVYKKMESYFGKVAP